VVRLLFARHDSAGVSFLVGVALRTRFAARIEKGARFKESSGTRVASLVWLALGVFFARWSIPGRITFETRVGRWFGTFLYCSVLFVGRGTGEVGMGCTVLRYGWILVGVWAAYPADPANLIGNEWRSGDVDAEPQTYGVRRPLETRLHIRKSIRPVVPALISA